MTNEFVVENGIAISDDTPKIAIVKPDIIDGQLLDYCFNNTVITNGEMLFSGAMMMNQESCKANSYNVGNMYSWGGALMKISSGDNANSLCPKGWLVPPSYGNGMSYESIMSHVYNVRQGSHSNDILRLPFSYTSVGFYNTDGNYSTLMSILGSTIYKLGHYFGSSSIGDIFRVQYNNISFNTTWVDNNTGASLRCGGGCFCQNNMI